MKANQIGALIHRPLGQRLDAAKVVVLAGIPCFELSRRGPNFPHPKYLRHSSPWLMWPFSGGPSETEAAEWRGEPE